MTTKHVMLACEEDSIKYILADVEDGLCWKLYKNNLKEIHDFGTAELAEKQRLWWETPDGTYSVIGSIKNNKLVIK